MWHMIHHVARICTPVQLLELVQCLLYLLPCADCRINLNNEIHALRSDLGRHSCSVAAYHLHNRVSRRVHPDRPLPDMSVIESHARYREGAVEHIADQMLPASDLSSMTVQLVTCDVENLKRRIMFAHMCTLLNDLGLPVPSRYRVMVSDT